VKVGKMKMEILSWERIGKMNNVFSIGWGEPNKKKEKKNKKVG